jgi:hypothetical protein
LAKRSQWKCDTFIVYDDGVLVFCGISHARVLSLRQSKLLEQLSNSGLPMDLASGIVFGVVVFALLLHATIFSSILHIHLTAPNGRCPNWRTLAL